MKNSIFIFWLAFFLFSSAGCNKEVINDDEETRSIVVFFTTQTHSLLKSIANHDEEMIEEVLLFGVDADNKVLQDFKVKKPSSDGERINHVFREVKSFYTIANPPEALSKAIEEKKPQTLSDLEKMTCNFSSAPKSPFLMSGKGDVNSFSATIELVRAVAKVKISSNSDFTIQSVTVYDTPSKGYVFKQKSLSVPESAEPIKYTTVYSTVDSPDDITLYVAENNILKPTKFVVTGTLDDDSREYTVELKKNGQNIDIVRNAYYHINVEPISESEVSITISSPEWNDVSTDPHSVPKTDPYKNGIKILAIGNSYSDDALRYMFDMLVQLGVDKNNIKLVNAFISGGTLDDHWEFISTGKHSDPTNKKLRRKTFIANGINNTDGDNVYSHEYMITQDNWDIITLQQFSGDSGRPEKYGNLQKIINYVKEKATSTNVKIGWHLTWAYAEPYIITVNAGPYPLKYSNQMDMYTKICSTVQELIKLKPAGDFDFIIPAGTAIQNARSIYGDNLNSDGTHLNNCGAYITGAMWIKTITGYNIANLSNYTADKITSYDPPYSTPPFIVNETSLGNVVQAVNAAYAFPFESTR